MPQSELRWQVLCSQHDVITFQMPRIFPNGMNLYPGGQYHNDTLLNVHGQGYYRDPNQKRTASMTPYTWRNFDARASVCVCVCECVWSRQWETSYPSPQCLLGVKPIKRLHVFSPAARRRRTSTTTSTTWTRTTRSASPTTCSPTTRRSGATAAPW